VHGAWELTTKFVGHDPLEEVLKGSERTQEPAEDPSPEERCNEREHDEEKERNISEIYSWPDRNPRYDMRNR